MTDIKGITIELRPVGGGELALKSIKRISQTIKRLHEGYNAKVSMADEPHIYKEERHASWLEQGKTKRNVY